MKILLVNPNTYRTPPVPPLGLLFIQASAKAAGYDCHILDLCFSENPTQDLSETIELIKPDIAGVTIRNIDTCLFDNNIFFLDGIKEIVGIIKSYGVPVVLGGAGFSFIPEGILEYIDADWGIKGPGENAFISFLESFKISSPEQGTIIDANKYGINLALNIDISLIDYKKYYLNRGIPGFETQKGCNGKCPFCGESRTKWMPRDPETIVNELRTFYNAGFNAFHLCDSEFNQNIDFCKNFLQTLINEGPSIKWALYMKSDPFDEEYFSLLKESGANLVTLSLPTGTNWKENVLEICRLTKKYSIKTAVDLLTGLPGDTDDSIKKVIEILRESAPDTVGVNSSIRLIPGAETTSGLMLDNEHRKFIVGPLEGNPHLIKPVFYIKFTAEKLRKIIGNDPLFKIEGFETTSNYERL